MNVFLSDKHDRYDALIKYLLNEWLHLIHGMLLFGGSTNELDSKRKCLGCNKLRLSAHEQFEMRIEQWQTMIGLKPFTELLDMFLLLNVRWFAILHESTVRDLRTQILHFPKDMLISFLYLLC